MIERAVSKRRVNNHFEVLVSCSDREIGTVWNGMQAHVMPWNLG